MQLLAFNIAAGETKVYEIAGRYLEVIDSAAAIDIYLSDTAGGRTDDARGALSGLYMEGEFARFEVYSATAQRVELLITDGRGGSRRQPGNVRIIDSNADKTQAGRQFIGSAAEAAVAGQHSVVSLKANGATLAIKRLLVSSTIAGQIQIFRAAAPGTAAAGAGPLQNKKLGQANAVAVGSGGFSLGLPMAAAEVQGYTALIQLSVQANQPVEVPLTTPLIISGTQMLGATGLDFNQQCGYTADFEEL